MNMNNKKKKKEEKKKKKKKKNRRKRRKEEKMPSWLLSLCWCGCFSLLAFGQPTTYFVQQGAQPGGEGTRDDPFDSMKSALAVAVDNDTIRVEIGLYGGPDNVGLTIEAGIQLHGVRL